MNQEAELLRLLTETATAESGNKEKTKYPVSEGTVSFILSMGQPAAPVLDGDGVLVELRKKIRYKMLLLQTRARRELCERGYVQQDHHPDSSFW